MNRQMVNSLFLLFLLIVSVSSQKQGDFGIFSVCSKNTQIVRLKCYYAECKDSPSFSCDFYSNGTHLGGSFDNSCQEGTEIQGPTTAINYTCILKRKKRRENKTVLIDPNATEIKHKLKICSGTLQLYQSPTFLWPLIVLPLWGLFETDRQLT